MTVNPITRLILMPATATTGSAQSRRMKECWTSDWGAGDRSVDMSTCTVGFRVDSRIRQRPKLSTMARIRQLPIGRAKNSARPGYGLVAMLPAPVLSRVTRVAWPRIGTNRTCSSATLRASGSPKVAAQNRRVRCSNTKPHAGRAEFFALPKCLFFNRSLLVDRRFRLGNWRVIPSEYKNEGIDHRDYGLHDCQGLEVPGF
jgi:hypothetical protein